MSSRRDTSEAVRAAAHKGMTRYHQHLYKLLMASDAYEALRESRRRPRTEVRLAEVRRAEWQLYTLSHCPLGRRRQLIGFWRETRSTVN